MKTRDVLAVFNRGRISKRALARSDVGRVALSAELQTNWMPRVLGSMMLRPGLKHLETALGDGASLPFVFSNSDAATLELSPSVMRVLENGDTLVSRPSVSTTITNGDFTSSLTGWTDADDAGASSDWSLGRMALVGTGTAAARRWQAVTVSGDEDVIHGLRIEVARGPVVLRVGTTTGADDVFRQAILRTGTHSIAFAPAGTFHIEFSSALSYPVFVESCTIESAGVVELPTPWADAETCKLVRWDQSGDVVFLGCEGLQQRRIERRTDNSWSVVLYEADNGPFLSENVDSISLTASAISGAITVTASRSVFQEGHVGAIFNISSQGQVVSANLSAELTYTDPIRVTGVTSTRIFSIIRTGTWVGTLTLQRSLGEVGAWEDVATYTTNATISYDDGLDNSIAFYRIGFNAGDYDSGTAAVTLNYEVGSITGVFRVTEFTSETEVDAVVLQNLGGTEATEIWAEGAWSDARGWPSAVAIWEGRMWWAGNGRVYGSVSDAFANFDPDFDGDAAPINRRIGEGVVNRINWVLPLQRLLAGSDGGEHTIRSNSFDEPVTPGNFNAKSPSTKGSAPIPAVSVDGRGYFVDRSLDAIFEMQYDSGKLDYSALETSLLVPEIGEGGFVRIAAQQRPDFRLHAIKADGTVAILVRDPAEDVLCWVDVETDGSVEDVIVLPGVREDRVIYRVARTIGGSTVRYHEEWAQERNCQGGALNLQADSHVTGTGAITGLSHLEGETVVIWGDGQDRGTAVVASGAIAQTYTTWCVGLGYTATYRSAKLAGQTSLGVSLTQRSRISSIGLVLSDTHAQGIQFGPSFETLDDLPAYENGELVDANSVWDAYDEGMVEFPGDWSTDNRLCLRAAAPRPCTVLAAVLSIERHDFD